MIVENRKLWVDQWDLSGDLQGVALELGHELQDDTVLGDSTRSHVPGLETMDLQHEGVWIAGVDQPDAIFEEHKGLADVLATVTPVNGTEGAIAYFCRTSRGLYTPGGKVGDLHQFSVSLKASGGYGAIRGTLMVNATKTSTATGTARQLGAVTAAQKLYAGLHVLTVSGTSPTLDVTVKSDDASGFPSATTRGTFAQKTAADSEWLTPVAGAITDDWWRVDWTLGGTTPSFEFVVSVGIL